VVSGQLKPGVRKYTELVAWQKAIGLVEAVYRISERFPRTEVYSLTSQIRRGVVSVPSNIAEGQSRKTSREFVRHLAIAYGALSEVETQLVIAERLKYITGRQLSDLLEQAAEVGRLINGLSNAIEKRIPTDH
jgi:four helix bundle protein